MLGAYQYTFCGGHPSELEKISLTIKELLKASIADSLLFSLTKNNGALNECYVAHQIFKKENLLLITPLVKS